MPRIEPLGAASRSTIAQQVGVLLPMVLASPTAGATAEVTEIIPLWILPADQVIGHGEELEPLTLNTGRWHAQVRVNGTPSVFARARALGGEDDWQVGELFSGPLAEKIDQAITWVDANVSSDATVRLLEVPNFQVVCFWLVDDANRGGSIIVVALPANARHLRLEHEYSSREFLEALRKEPIATGID